MKNILIGFLMATCIFLMIDVETGELYKKGGMNYKKAWKKVSGADWKK